ncbi:MAG: cyclic-di-AMP receptor [Clostridia bacterium]|nr:cyclic-di-AMP receptor [Clostridia bacterium]MBQ9966165.1 cyclic-di-AMP receptor [Clostridia bacterium]
MKMIMAILNAEDAPIVIRNLMKNKFSITKLATQGGFLRTGNVTIMSGVDDDRLDEALAIIKENSHSRKQMIAPTAEPGLSFYPTMPIEVIVGGATIFVLPIERFEKV